MLPSSFSTAQSLYTPPKTGQLLEVMSRSPTPKESILAPCWMMLAISRSSRELETVMVHSVQPASSSIFLAFLVR